MMEQDRDILSIDLAYPLRWRVSSILYGSHRAIGHSDSGHFRGFNPLFVTLTSVAWIYGVVYETHLVSGTLKIMSPARQCRFTYLSTSQPLCRQAVISDRSIR